MPYTIQVDSNELLNELENLGQKRQLPYIISKALNRLAVIVQGAEREMLPRKLNVRRGPWLDRQIKIDKGTWALKSRLYIKIYTTDNADFLSMLDEGGEHVPLNGHNYLTAPNPKVFGKSVIGPDNPLRVKNLQLNQTKWGLRGLERTFMVVSKESGKPLILQRTSPDDNRKRRRGTNRKTGVRLLYSLLKAIKVPHKITWETTASNAVSGHYYGCLMDALGEAMSKFK